MFAAPSWLPILPAQKPARRRSLLNSPQMPRLSHHPHLFRFQVQKYISELVARTKPRRVGVCPTPARHAALLALASYRAHRGLTLSSAASHNRLSTIRLVHTPTV